MGGRGKKKKKAHHTAAATSHVAANGEETPPVAASWNANQPPMPTSVMAADGGDVPPPVEAANGDNSSPVDSAAAANPAGVPPSPPAVEASNGDGEIPPPSIEAANGGEPTAKTEPDVEVPVETRPEHEAERLAALNGMLVKETVETRGLMTAVTAQIDQRSADAGTLADLERVIVRDALVAPIQAAAQDGAALRRQLNDVKQSLQLAEARVARETDARVEAVARLEAAEAEKLRAEELLRGKEAEAATASENVTQLEAAVGELAGKSTELCAERCELEKRLGEATASADNVHALKAEVEESFSYYKKNTEIQRQEMEGKLEEKSKQLEGLRSSMEELEAKVRSLEAELSATLSRNKELEEMGTSKTELDAARNEVEKLQSEAANASNKYTTMVAQVGHFRNEIEKMTTTNEVDAAAFASEKTKLEKELDGLKRKVEKIQANKDAAMASAHQKDAEAAKLRAELNALQGTIAGQHALCDDLSGKCSSLQDEKDVVLKALGEEKAQGDKLRLRLVELERYNADKDREIVVLKAQVENKEGEIASLSGKIEELDLAVAEARHRGKSGAWTWLCPTTTVIAAASFAYAVRNR